MTEAIDLHLAAAVRGEAILPEQASDNPIYLSADFADAAWQRIAYHGIAGLLAANIAHISAWPESLRALVRKEAQMQAFWEESHRTMLTDLLARLASDGIDSLLMKGSALAYSVYADPSARRRGDSDLLVRPADLAATRDLLERQGFVRRENPHGLFFQETWLIDTGIGLVHAVDLHWQPSDSPAVQKVLRREEYFESRRSLPRLSSHAAMPSEVLTFLQGAINQAWHGAKGYFVGEQRMEGERRLIWAYDNHLLASHFSEEEWDELARLAATRGIAPLCLDALQSARQLCGTVVPADVLELLRGAGKETNLVRHIVDKDQITAFFTDIAAIPTIRAKVTFALGHALPDSGHLRRKYPDAAAWPTWLLHLRRIGESAVRWMKLK